MMMNRLSYLFCCLFLLIGCNKSSIKSHLDAYEADIERNPKSVYEILLNSKPETDEDCARHTLMTIKAKNLAYIPLESADTTMVLEAIDYYRKQRDIEQVMLGYYLLGSIYRDLGDSPRGVEAFQKVIEVADTTQKDCDYRLMARAEAQKSDLQRLQKVIPKAIESSFQAEYYAWKARDTSYAIQVAFETIGLQSLNGNKSPLKEQAPYLVKKCLDMGDSVLAIYESVGFAWDYLLIGMTDKARRMIQLYDLYNGTPYPIYYGTKGELYLAQQQLDSAEWCFRKELEAMDWNNRQAAYRGLKKVYEQRHLLDSALKYATLQCEAVDSDYHHKVSESIIQMEHIYNYEASKEQARQSEMNRQKLRNVLTFSLLIGGLIVFAMATALLAFRNRQQRRMQEKEKALAQEEERRVKAENRAAEMETMLMQVHGELGSLQQERDDIQRALAELRSQKNGETAMSEVTLRRINELETRLKEKEQDIREMEQEVHQKEQELLARQEEMDKMVVSIEALQQEARQMENLGDGVRQMRRQLELDKCATSRNWEALQRQIVKLYPSFIQTLRKQVKPILQNELRVAMLIKMDFQPAQIAELMGLSAPFVSKTRRRLYFKAFGKYPESTKDVDDWILSIS